MGIRPPTKDDLRRLAAENFIELNQEELEVFESLIKPMVERFDRVHNAPASNGPLKHRDRDPGGRPNREEDPLNAIVRSCSVKGAASGKLVGKRIGLKDNICVSGIPMTCGSLVLEGFVPDIDATIVTRMLDEGAEIAAMLNMDDFAYSGAGAISAYGPTLNPHNPEYLTGGSSGGSGSSLYYDYIDMTIGCDQGGSIRLPASWCGVVGLKPTHGLVPYTGIVGADATIDHTGPMARAVEDVALLLEVLAGKDPLDPRQGEVIVHPYTEALGQDVRGLRIGVVQEGFELKESEPDVDAAVHNAVKVLEGLGVEVSEVSIPAHREAGGIIAWAIAAEGGTAGFHSNGAGYHQKGLHNVGLTTAIGKSRRTQGNDFPPSVKIILLVGTYLSQNYHGSVYGKAQNLSRSLRASYDQALEQVDVLAMPTTPMKAHKYRPDVDLRGLMDYSLDMAGNTSPTNVTGHPAISVPCAKSSGLPVGLMLIGRHFDEMTLVRTAHAFETSVNWEELS